MIQGSYLYSCTMITFSNFGFLLFILPVFCLQGCKPDTTGKDKTVFHLNYSSGSLEAIDPAFAKDLYQIWTCHMVYNTLVETDEQLHITPSLARSWEISADGRTYLFHLRTDVFFHDNAAFPGGKGRKFVARDVAYRFSRLIAPATAGSGAWIFNSHIADTNAFVAINDSTFQLTLNQPFSPMLGSLSMAYCNIVPEEIVRKWGKDYRSHPCGTGPFCFSYWDEGNSLCLLKNPRYWEHDNTGVQLPYIDAVQISFVDSKATEFLLFLQNKLDFVNGIDGSFKDLILTKEGTVKPDFKNKFRLGKNTYLNTEYIGFLTDTANAMMKGEPTGNVLIRQAINYAVNRKKIVTYYKNGMGIPATHGFIPAGIPGYDSTAAYGYDYNPDKARALLARAGYPGGKGLKPIKILVPDNQVDIVNYVASELQDVGIPAIIETIQPNILKQQMSRSQAIFFRADWLADYPDAETFLVVFNSRQPAPPNYTRFQNDTFDSWYSRSLNMRDTARWALYRKMDSLAISYAPVLPLFYDMRMHFTQNNISGFRSNAMNVIDIKQVQFKK